MIIFFMGVFKLILFKFLGCNWVWEVIFGDLVILIIVFKKKVWLFLRWVIINFLDMLSWIFFFKNFFRFVLMLSMFFFLVIYDNNKLFVYCI